MNIWGTLGSGIIRVLVVGGAIACLAIWIYTLVRTYDRIKFLLKTALAVFVLVLGGGGAFLMIITVRKPGTGRPKSEGTLVEVVRAATVDHPAKIEAMGTVMPARELEVRAEVGGRIVRQSQRLVPGSVLSADEAICEIDPRDYRAILDARKADLQRARTALELEEGQGEIARREWELLGKDLGTKGARKDLALRKPQLEQARAAVKAAESAVAKAELDLERTTISVPFPAVIREEFVEKGQLVSPQSSIARLAGAEKFWVRCSVPTDRLEHIVLPGPDGSGGARARVFQSRPDTKPAVRSGRVVRLLPELDPAGRMARVLVEVSDPLNTAVKRTAADGSQQPPPLLLGSFVRVEIDGPVLSGVVPLSRKALRDGSSVWVMGADGKLELRKAKIAWSTRDQVLLSAGVSSGEAVVTSGINGAYPGMQLRLAGKKEPRASGEEAPPTEGGNGRREGRPGSREERK